MTFRQIATSIILVMSCSLSLTGADSLTLPDTQTTDFTSIIARYNSALEAAQNKHKSAMTQHIQHYLDNAGEMLKEKRKARNTTGIAIASTANAIFESALSNFTHTGTFEIPAKVRRDLETTMAEFNTGRSLIDTSFTSDKAKLLKQFEDEFAAQILKTAPTLTSPEARAKMDECFLTMASATSPPTPKADSTGKPTTPPPTDTGTNVVINPLIAESGTSPTWTTVGTLTANIRSMEVLEIPLAEMRMGSNLLNQYSVMSGTTTEIQLFFMYTNFTGPTVLYRLLRIPKFNEVSIMDWPTASNGYRLNLRTPSPERTPFPIGFELQVSVLPAYARPPVKRNITLSIKSTPPRASIHIDGLLQQDLVTPCTLQLPVGPHDFRLELKGFQDLVVTNYNFTANREINWIFKPFPATPGKR